MTKSSHSLAPVKGQKGQISIFFSASLVVLITIVAFVINIGLFVKAKINLQNATDSAAFAGAAVQSRQLTTIAYLNWEMRNIYKEWMYKYYVVGNLNIKDVEDPAGATNDTISYRLRPTTDVLNNNKAYNDVYNFPSVCIHLAGSQTNLCKRYSVPGLPEFGSSNLPGAEEASRAFINTLIGTKVLDCVDQTKLNMLVNLTWAYNVLTIEGDETIVEQGPQIMADKMGAWPKAVEVAMRIRNLELAVNRPPEIGGVCASKNNSGKVRCGKEITEIGSQNLLGNERLIKAYTSAFRNLGNEIESEMKDSFTLTEIPPKDPELGSGRSASYLLVPANRAGQAYPKPYLDLQLMMVNYATFYNAFVPRSTKTQAVPTSGACDVSKVAMPVPGYPLGFYKNPDVMTYYAVRGEAEFVGMFNPFSDGAVKLTSYSAAKPFGGRIGPRLFFQAPNTDYFVGRTNPTSKRRSVPYIASLDFEGTVNIFDGSTIKLGDFAPGVPLPINFPNDYFWLKEANSPLGGYIAGDDVQFGLPNLVYDYQTPYSNASYTTLTDDINMIKTMNPDSADKAIGLFSKYQLQQFKGPNLGTDVSQSVLNQEIQRIKAPTLYESANYLIPSPDELNDQLNLDSVGFIPGKKNQNGKISSYKANIYAPLYSQDQDDVFWKNGNDVVTTAFEFLREQKSGIMKYKRSMIKAAMEIDSQGGNLAADASGAAIGFTKAAKGVADVDFTGSVDQDIGSCASLAGVFLYFYYGDGALFPNMVKNKAGCPQTLGENLRSYFSGSVAGAGFSASHYQMDYNYNSDMQKGPQSLFTAFMPGQFTGVGEDGVFKNPIPGTQVEDETMRRNFYSTKFVQLGSLTGSGGWSEATSNFVMYSEGALNTSADFDGAQKQYKNPLEPQAVSADINAIKY